MPQSSRRCCCLIIMPLTFTQNQTDNLQASILLKWFIQSAAWMYFEEQFPPPCFRRSLLNKWTATSKIQLSPPFHTYDSVLPANLPLDLIYLSCPITKYIQEQVKATGSSSFTSVLILSSAFPASRQNPYFPLEWSTLLRSLRWKAKADLLLEPPAQIAHPHLHFDQRNKQK